MINPEEMADKLSRKLDTLGREKKAAVLSRFKLFLTRESAVGGDGHPAAVALQVIEAGESGAALKYLDAEIERIKVAKAGTDDEVTKARLDVRQNDLERWKQNLV